jgi:phospholipid/cholesterol/gamma-HCH transport system substrate-binding protein
MFRSLEYKVGLFILITSVLIVSAIGYVAYKKDVFSRMDTYTLASFSGEDLTEGMPVLLSGYKIGRVDALELGDDGRILIRIKILHRHAKWLRRDSVFIINKPLIGDPRIVLSTGKMSSPPLSTEAIKEVVVANDINTTIKKLEPVVERLNRITINIETLTANLVDPKGNVNQILRHTETLAERLARTDSLLDLALGNPDTVSAVQEALKNTEEITTEMTRILKTVDAMAVKSDEALYGKDGIFPSMRTLLVDLVGKLAKLDQFVIHVNNVGANVDASTKDLGVLRRDIDETISTINSLVKELDRKIPFRKEPRIKLP